MGERDDVVTRQAVGRHLRRLRKTLGWTLEKTARKASAGPDGLTASTLSRLERGESGVAVETLSRLCHCLGTDLASIDEVIRAAEERSDIDLGDAGYDELLEEGHRRGSRGDVSGALARFEAAEDWGFMALFGAWKLRGRAGDREEAERLATALRHILPRVSPGLPEAGAFRSLSATADSGNSRRQP